VSGIGAVDVVTEKKALEAELADIKHRMLGCGRLPDFEWRTLSARRSALVRRLGQLDLELTRRKAEKHAKALSEDAGKRDVRVRHTDLLGHIVSLRDRYREAAKDPRHTEAVRFMYQRFVEDLDRAMQSTVIQ
jgi:hypothetical protein